MRIPKILVPAALGALLAACNGSEAPAGPAAPPAINEADLVATWKMDQPALGDTVKITMSVSADHTVLVSVNSTVQGGDGSRFRAEVRREAMQWTLTKNNWVSEKTACHYMDKATGELKASACEPPLQEAAQVGFKDGDLTLLKGDITYIFKKN